MPSIPNPNTCLHRSRHEGDLVVSVALEVLASVLAHVVGEGSGWRAVVTGNLMTLG